MYIYICTYVCITLRQKPRRQLDLPPSIAGFVRSPVAGLWLSLCTKGDSILAHPKSGSPYKPELGARYDLRNVFHLRAVGRFVSKSGGCSDGLSSYTTLTLYNPHVSPQYNPPPIATHYLRPQNLKPHA